MYVSILPKYETVGSVISILILLTAVLALLKARSVDSSVTLWFSPAVLRVVGEGQESTPEISSWQSALIVTSVLFQLFALGGGSNEPVITGTVLSNLTVMLCGASLLSLLSVAK